MASIIISNKIISGNFVGLFDYVYTKLIFFSFPCLEEVLILIAPWIENARVEKHLKLDHENAYKITLNAFNTEKQIIGINKTQGFRVELQVSGERGNRLRTIQRRGKDKTETRWTFFRVKLVFECEFEISWSFGPWDLGTPGP